MSTQRWHHLIESRIHLLVRFNRDLQIISLIDLKLNNHLTHIITQIFPLLFLHCRLYLVHRVLDVSASAQPNR